MSTSRNGPAIAPRAAGFSMVELLIALSITAILMVATVVAFDAALYNYRANQDIASVSITSRNALYQMVRTIRLADNNPSTDTIDISGDGAQCDLVDSAGRNVVYNYDSGSKQLQVRIDGSDWYTLVENVYPVSAGEPIFSPSAPPPSGGFDVGTVGRVEIRFKIEQNGISKSVSAGVVPRNILYN